MIKCHICDQEGEGVSVLEQDGKYFCSKAHNDHYNFLKAEVVRLEKEKADQEKKDVE